MIHQHEMVDWTEVDRRLIQWAIAFRDRSYQGRTGSLEGYYLVGWDDEAEGWGTAEAIPVQPRIELDWREIIRTHAIVQRMDRGHKWSLTVWYCYPWWPTSKVMAVMRKHVRRMSLADYRELVYLARSKCYRQFRMETQ